MQNDTAVTERIQNAMCGKAQHVLIHDVSLIRQIPLIDVLVIRSPAQTPTSQRGTHHPAAARKGTPNQEEAHRSAGPIIAEDSDQFVALTSLQRTFLHYEQKTN